MLILLALALGQVTTAPTPPAAAPTAQPTGMGPPPAFAAAAQAFGTCLGTKSGAAPATATPDDAARTTIAACQTEQTALSTQFESWITGPTFPAAYRDAARAQFQARMAAVPAQVSQQIAQRRAGATPGAPAPAPVPSPTPGR